MPQFLPSLSLFAISLFLLNVSDAQAQKESKPSTKSAARSVTLFAAGDIADCRRKPAEQTMAAQTANLIENGLAQDKNAYAITLGDNTYPIGKPSEFSDCYDKTWGKFKTRTLPSPGNHDYGVPLAQGYYNYFDELAGKDRLGYYKKVIGNWTLLSLNSNIKHQAMREQITWLKNELKENQSACVLAFWHHPVFSSGGHGDTPVMQEIWQLLADTGTDIVLASHDHNYERFTPLDKNGRRSDKGIRSFVVGTGGAKLTPMFFPKSISDIRQNEVHGVLKLQLHANSYDWEFLATSATNAAAFSDKGQGNCLGYRKDRQ
jgi:hypothetical protein